MTIYRYSGDRNLEQGGYFFSTGAEELRYGYSSVVRVTPCADAGGPDNCFWVETYTVSLPERDETQKLDNALQHLGQTHADLKKLTKHQRFALLVDACLSYGYADPDDLFSMKLPQSQIVRIGPRDELWTGHDDFTPNTTLRGNTSLRRWVKRTYLKG